MSAPAWMQSRFARGCNPAAPLIRTISNRLLRDDLRKIFRDRAEVSRARRSFVRPREPHGFLRLPLRPAFETERGGGFRLHVSSMNRFVKSPYASIRRSRKKGQWVRVVSNVAQLHRHKEISSSSTLALRESVRWCPRRNSDPDSRPAPPTGFSRPMRFVTAT